MGGENENSSTNPKVLLFRSHREIMGSLAFLMKWTADGPAVTKDSTGPRSLERGGHGEVAGGGVCCKRSYQIRFTGSRSSRTPACSAAKYSDRRGPPVRPRTPCSPKPVPLHGLGAGLVGAPAKAAGSRGRPQSRGCPMPLSTPINGGRIVLEGSRFISLGQESWAFPGFHWWRFNWTVGQPQSE